jgi:hypothetical protein
VAVLVIGVRRPPQNEVVFGRVFFFEDSPGPDC